MSNNYINEKVIDFKQFVKSTIENFSNNISKIKLGLTATREIFDLMYVNNNSITDLCVIKIENAFKVVLKPYKNQNIKEIYKVISISKFDLQTSLNANNEIEITFPNLTNERKENYINIAKQELERYKDSFKKYRNKFRNDFIKDLNSTNSPKDTLRNFDEQINNITKQTEFDMEHIYENFVKSLKK